MNKERLIAFTDAILAIIMTILVLELDKPKAPTVAAFWALRTNYFSYALSFFWLGSMWVALNNIWEQVKRIDSRVIWWNLFLLFFASLIPYATSLCSRYFDNATMQGFYGIIVIAMTACNYCLHRALIKPNCDAPILQTMAKTYCRMLLPDIVIKLIGLVFALTVYPPIMMYSVLIAAAYILTLKHFADKKAAALRKAQYLKDHPENQE